MKTSYFTKKGGRAHCTVVSVRTCLVLGGVGDFYDSRTRITNVAFTLPLYTALFYNNLDDWFWLLTQIKEKGEKVAKLFFIDYIFQEYT